MTYLGDHTMAVQRGLNLGVALFIASEALFFLAIFWAFFHSMLALEISKELIISIKALLTFLWYSYISFEYLCFYITLIHTGKLTLYSC